LEFVAILMVEMCRLKFILLPHVIIVVGFASAKFDHAWP